METVFRATPLFKQKKSIKGLKIFISNRTFSKSNIFGGYKYGKAVSDNLFMPSLLRFMSIAQEVNEKKFQVTLCVSIPL